MNTKVFFSTEVNRNQQRALNSRSVQHRLISFASLPTRLTGAKSRVHRSSKPLSAERLKTKS
jgi:hypothetical protein